MLRFAYALTLVCLISGSAVTALEMQDREVRLAADSRILLVNSLYR